MQVPELSMDAALLMAAHEGDVLSLIELVAANPDTIYSVTSDQNTALHIAASHGHDWFVHHLLLYMNLNVEFIVRQNSEGDTPLHRAVRAGYLVVVEHLICYVAWAKKIQSNLQEPLVMLNKRGYTLLHEVVIHKQYHVADIILKCTKQGIWQISKAIIKDYHKYSNDDFQIKDVFNAWGPLIIGDIEGNNPLHIAVIRGISDMAIRLLDADPKCAHLANLAMQSPLYIAVMNGLDHIVNKIAKQDLPVSSISISVHGTALHQAVLADNMRALEILLNKSVKLLNVPDSQGDFPIHYAAKANNVRMISMLLRKDFTLAYKQTTNNYSPLHVAAQYNALDAVKELLKQRPDVIEMVDITGKNIFHIAVINSDIDMLKWLLKWLPEELINCQDKDGNTPLHLATSERLVEHAALLLNDPRVDPCVTNMEGDTAYTISRRIGIMNMIPKEVQLWKELKKRECTRCKQQRERIPFYWQRPQYRDASGIRKYIVVPTLITMATFIATLSNSRRSSYATVENPLASKICIFCNTISMCSSITVILSIWHWSSDQVKLMLYGFILASRLIILAGVTMIMSMLTTVYLSIEPASEWPTYMLISMGVTALFLFCLKQLKRVAPILLPMGW